MNLTLQPSEPLPLFFFVLVVAAVLGAISWAGFRRGRAEGRSVSLYLAIWVVAMSAFVASGFPERNPPAGVPVLLGATMASALGFASGRWGRALGGNPVWMLAAFQAFRLPLELVLHAWAEGGTVPETMTWTGQNLDVWTGIVALGAFLPPLRTRGYAWLVNAVGSLLLLNVIRVAVLSSPLPFAWPLERPLLLGTRMPYAMIAFVCVWAAVAGHVALTRALLAGRPGDPRNTR